MNSGTQERIQTELTPQEAEAVLELWAQKQAEGELRSRLNVQDLAEATGLAPEEIERMVASVRSSKIAPPLHGEVKKAKPVNTFLIAVAVVVWIGILMAVGMAAYQEGRYGARSATISIAPPPFADFGTPVAPGMIGELAPSPSLENAIHNGSALDFQGYSVTGKSNSLVSEDTIHQALQAVVSNLESESGLQIGPDQPMSSILQSLKSDDGTRVNDEIAFPKMVVSTGALKKELGIPVARVGNPSIVEAVRIERTKRLRILSNWLVNNNPWK